jgi:hypothetical protein
MFGLLRVLRVLAPLAVVCGALFAVSCGSNNSSPSSTPTSYPTNGSDVITLTASAGTIPLPAVSPGNYVNLNYIGSSATPFPSPLPSAGITMTAVVLAAPPTNAPLPTSAKRAPLSRSNAVGVTYVTFTLSTALPANFISGETLNLAPSLPVNQAYFVELDDLTTGTYINTYPGTAVSNGATTFTNANGFVAATDLSKMILNTTDTYLYQFYYLSNGSLATPTPSPSPAASSSASPYPTPTPVVVATTEPMGSAFSVTLPVTSGGFIASVGVPAAGTSATSLTLSGATTLPNTIPEIGTTNSLYPYYVLGFTATGSVTLPASPLINVQLPTNFADTTTTIFAALCTAAACPVDTNDSAVAPSAINNGLVTFNAGAFPGFTSVGTTTQYVIVYTSRSTPVSQSTSVPFAAGSAGSITVPPITTTAGTYASTVNLSGLSAATTVNVAAQTGLFTGITAIVPNKQSIVYALAINANPHVSTSGLVCGSSGCSTVVLTVPSSVIAAASGKTFYVEECSATACPVSSGDEVALLAPNSSNQLFVNPSTFGADITSLDPTSTLYLVFFYQ